MHERGVLTLSESVWAKAKRRAEVIGPLAQLEIVGQVAAKEAAAQLGVSSRQVYELIRRYRAGTGLVTDLAPGKSGGGRGKARIPAEVEGIVANVIETLYLSRQRRSEAVIAREIAMRCRRAGYRLPARNTIRLRIQQLDPELVTHKREGADRTRRLQPAAGETPLPTGPLDVVQMDHTKMDVIVVEEISREPIGRPSLTLAIDVFTRCIVGMLLTLEAPSATSVGLCLAHIVMNKGAWLARLGLSDLSWPMHGKPKKIHLDNAPEFKSEALKRGCEQHGIERDYRPVKQPHFGGIIERVIGTAMKMAHELPGTTFSNISERGGYDAEATAILTMGELEKWMALAVGTYHESVHGSLLETPAACWARSIQSSKVFTVADERAFLIDFLPVVRRSITRTGFVIDRIAYYSNILKPWIARRDLLGKFVIRRDPRDIGRVWVLDPESNRYLEIPYRSLSNPTVTLWEHRKAVEELRKRGRAQVDESAIFRMITQMREITDTAAKERKRARRDKTRRSHLDKVAHRSECSVPDDPVLDGVSARPFDDIEEW